MGNVRWYLIGFATFNLSLSIHGAERFFQNDFELAFNKSNYSYYSEPDPPNDPPPTDKRPKRWERTFKV